MPQLFSGFEVIACHHTIAIADNLCSLVCCNNSRRLPRRDFTFSIDATNLKAGCNVKNSDEVRIQAVALHNHFAIMDDRLTGKAPLQKFFIVGSGMKAAEVVLPLQLSTKIKAVQAF